MTNALNLDEIKKIAVGKKIKKKLNIGDLVLFNCRFLSSPNEHAPYFDNGDVDIIGYIKRITHNVLIRQSSKEIPDADKLYLYLDYQIDDSGWEGDFYLITKYKVLEKA